MRKKFDELTIGDFVADMHYGLEPLRSRFDVVSHVRWDEPRPDPLDTKWKGRMYTGYVEHAFHDYLQQFGPGAYTNKELRVIGFDDASTNLNPILICGYCYDGRRSGIVILKRRADPA